MGRLAAIRAAVTVGILALTLAQGLRIWPGVQPFVMPTDIRFAIREETVAADQVPTFIFQGGWNAKVQSLSFRAPGGNPVTPQYSVSIVPGSAGDREIVPKPLQVFHPGLYEAVLRVIDRGRVREYSQAFYWGVVAVDVRSSVAAPYTREDIEIAVLDDIGRTVCDSEIEVTVTGPNGNVQEFSTKDGGVIPNPACQDRSVTNVPDYRVPYVVGDVGDYVVNVIATTVDGPRWMKDTFTVGRNPNFDITRTGFPTRIYPPAAYPVAFTVTPREDFAGMVVERVPASFAIDEIGQGGVLDDSEYHDGTRNIIWGVSLEAGKTYTFEYRFDAPNISPLLHRLQGFMLINTSGTRVYAEPRQWQIASDATKTWDGGGTTDAWSECANWNLNTCPANTGDDILFDGTSNDASTWDSGSTVTSVSSITITSMSGLFTITKSPVTVTGNFSHTSTGNVVFTGSASITVGGDYVLTNSGSLTANTSTLTLNGLGESINTTKTHANLTINPASASTISALTSSFAVSGTLTVASADTFDISSGLTVTSGSSGTVSLSGSITGAGTLAVQHSNLSTGGTLSSAVRFDATSGDITMPARTYGGSVEVYSNAGFLARTVTPSAGTHTIGGSLHINAAAFQNITLAGATNNPNFVISGDLDFVGSGGGSEIITSGTGTWTVTGNVDFTDGTYTATAGNTLAMNGSSKTLTTSSNTLQNLNISGAVTLASATHTVSGNLDVTGATITPGTSTIVMNGTGGKTITGGTVSLYNLTINPSSADTVTVVSGTISVGNTFAVANGHTVSIASGANVNVAGTSGTSLSLNSSGTISGAGRLIYQNPNVDFPTSGTISSVVRFESTAVTTVSIPERHYGGNVEAYINSSATGETSVVLGSGVDDDLVIDGDFVMVNDNKRGLLVDGVSLGPNMIVGGDIRFVQNSTGSITYQPSTLSTTVSGDVDLRNGTLEASNGGDFIMDGTADLIGNGQTFTYLTINGDGNTVTVTDSDVIVAIDLVIGGGADGNDDTLAIASGRTVTSMSTGFVVFQGSGTDSITGAGTLVVQNSNLDTGGVLSSQVRFDAVDGDITMPNRTYGSNVEIYNNSVTNNRTITMSAGTHTISGSLALNAGNTRNVLLSGDSNNPTVTIGADLDFTGVGTGSESITTGSGTWTVAGDVDFSGGTVTATSGNTLTMTGTSGNSIVGAGQTLYNLTINPSSAATITAETSDLTVTNTLNVAASDTLSIASGVALTHSGATLTLVGTISGSGTLVYQSGSAFPTSGTISSALRFDATNTDQTMSARTYGGLVEVFSDSSISSRMVVMGAGTHTFASSLIVSAADNENITLTGASNSPDVSVAGEISFEGAGSGGEILVSGAGTWTAGGNIDFTNGVFTATSGNEVVMTGTANLIGNSQSFYDLTVNGSGSTVTVSTSDVTVTNVLTIGAADDGNNDTLTIEAGRTLTSASGASVQITGSGTDTITGAGRLTIAHSNLSTGGVLSSVVRFDASGSDISMPARTYGSDVEINVTASDDRSVTMASGTHTIGGGLLVSASGNNAAILDASVNNPDVTVASDIDFTGVGSGTESIRSGTGTWTVSGNIDLSGGTFTAAAGNLLHMDGTSVTLTSGGQQLHSLTTSGSVMADDALALAGDLTVDSGTLVGETSINVFGGDATGDGTLTASDFTIDGTGNFGGSATWTFDTLTFGDGSGTSTTTASGSGDIAVSGVLTIASNQAFNAGSKTLTLSGTGTPFVASGTLVPSTSTFVYTGNGATTVAPSSYATLQIKPSANGVTHTLASGTFTVSESFTIGNGTNIATVTAETHDPILDIADDVIIASNATFAASSSASLQVGGNWANSGTFNSGTGTVTFDAADTGNTIEPGVSSFHGIALNNASGGWILQSADVLATGDVTFTAAESIALQSGRTLEVRGNFTNAVAGDATTWAGTTLHLNGSGGMYDVNSKTQGGDTYATLRIGASEDVALWDSTIGTLTIDAGGCLFSQDDEALAGRMHIHGTCNTRASEHWSYATDFDGAALAGSSRSADIRFAAGATLTVDAGDMLTIAGQSVGANRTAVTRQSSGNFGITVAGTLNAQNADFDHLNSAGLNILSTATIAELSNASFDNIGAGVDASYITVDGVSSTKTFSSIIFDANADGADTNVSYNVNANGTGIVWTFDGAAGNRTGAEHDRAVGGATIVWLSTLAVADGTGVDRTFINTPSSLSANWAIGSLTNLSEYRYAIGTTAGGTDILAFTSTGSSDNVTKTGLSLVNGATYYVTVRALTATGELIVQQSSNGVTVDTDLAVFSGISQSKTSSSFTISWTSTEATTTKLRYGLTAAYGTETVIDASLTTSHTATISGLSSGTTYHFQIIGEDRAGNVTQSTDATVTTNAPENTVITNVQVARKSPTSVIVTWLTNHPSDSKVRYGLTTDYGSEAYDGTLVINHSLTLTGLTPDTQYHYEVLSTGNSVAIDADSTFSTPPDDAPVLAPPTLVSPRAATTIRTPELLITGNATSGSDVFIVMDGEILAVVKTTASTTGVGHFSYKMQTALSVGQHTIFTRARLDGVVSDESAHTQFGVLNPSFVTPTLLTPIVRDGRDPSITLVGVARSNSFIRMYINNEQTDLFWAGEHMTGTSNFYRELKTLQPGNYVIQLQAVSESGETSAKSLPVHFTVTGEEGKTPTAIKPDATVSYVVKPGDSLWKIATLLYGKGALWQRISAANRARFPQLVFSPTVIQPGWLLTIPPLR